MSCGRGAWVNSVLGFRGQPCLVIPIGKLTLTGGYEGKNRKRGIDAAAAAADNTCSIDL